jgi:hypothetical protein
MSVLAPSTLLSTEVDVVENSLCVDYANAMALIRDKGGEVLSPRASLHAVSPVGIHLPRQ